MISFNHILNLVLGGLSNYAYSISVGFVTAFTPIRSSAFLINDCRRLPGADLSDSCRFLNYSGLLAHDFIHFMFISVILATVVGIIHKLISRKGLSYNFRSFSVGFLVVWVATMIWAIGSLVPNSWYIFLVWVLELSVFLTVYHLVTTHVLKVKSPNI